MSEQIKKPLIDWQRVDTVMLDMDGTLLDLAYDNWFWQRHIPTVWGQMRGLSFEESFATLVPKFNAVAGTLEWYCLEYWSGVLELDVIQMKEETRERIGLRPGVEAFLAALRVSGRQPWLVTNAHGSVLDIKMRQTGLSPAFRRLVTTHDYGYPKEMHEFWDAMQARFPFDPDRTLLIDDSFPVLESARSWGVGQTVGVLEPDSSTKARESSSFELIGHYDAHHPNA